MLKWLRFLGYAIYGREGYLSTSETGPEINDYTANIEAVHIISYQRASMTAMKEDHC